MKRIELNIYDLCEEIDYLKTEVDYWKNKYNQSEAERQTFFNQQFEESKKGVANALMFALSVSDNPDGSLSISKDKRKKLAKDWAK